MIRGEADLIITEIKYTINVMHFSHPKTIPHPSYEEKLASTKLDPGAKKVGTTVERTDLQ